MGHNIEYYEYPESVDKNKVYSELGTMVYYRCIQEGGRLSAIRWLESSAPILNGRDAAEEYIKAHDKGWYDCLAVRFHPQSTKESEREKRKNQIQSAQPSIGGVVLYSAFSEYKSRVYRLQRMWFSNFQDTLACERKSCRKQMPCMWMRYATADGACKGGKNQRGYAEMP